MIRPIVLRTALALALTLPALATAVAATSVPSQPRPAQALPVILVAEQVAIGAAETVDPRAPVVVTISGSRPGGRVELWGPVTQTGKGGMIDSVEDSAGAAVLDAPARPGSYELRYVSGAGRVLARASLDVASQPIVLSAPSGLSAGIDTAVEWRGPASPGDLIQVYDPGTGTVVSSVPATGQPGAVNVAMLRGPERLGNYQIRYWSGAWRVALRSLPVTVEAIDAWLRSPIEVFVNEVFAVQWLGPAQTGLAFQLVDPAAGTVLKSQPVPASKSGNLGAPVRPGAYRVRVVNLETGFVFSDLPLDVDPR